MLSLGCSGACLHKDLLPTRVSINTFMFDDLYQYFVPLYMICSWPVRTLSFSHDSQMIATASEDLFIDIVSHNKQAYIINECYNVSNFQVEWVHVVSRVEFPSLEFLQHVHTGT